MTSLSVCLIYDYEVVDVNLIKVLRNNMENRFPDTILSMHAARTCFMRIGQI